MHSALMDDFRPKGKKGLDTAADRTVNLDRKKQVQNSKKAKHILEIVFGLTE